MELNCIALRKALKTAIKTINLSRELTNRLKSLKEMIIRLSDINVEAIWIEFLLENTETFISHLKINPPNIIDSELKQLEKEVISTLVVGLNIPAVKFEILYSQVIENNKKLKLSEILPKFLLKYFRLKMKNSYLLRSIFEMQIFNIFNNFQIPYNFYVQRIANNHFGNDINYNMEILEKFLTFFFGPIENYKFYVKIARSVDVFKEKLINQGYLNYEINLSKSNWQYPDDRSIQKENESLLMTWPDIRKDGLIIFGSHPDSDIVLPSDEKLRETLTLILVKLRDGIMAIDLSKKMNIGIKMKDNENYFLKKGMLINLAGTQTFHVEDIKQESNIMESDEHFIFFYDYIEENVDSVVTIKFIEGVFEEIKYNLSTKTKNPNLKKIKHKFGYDVPDLRIPMKTGVSKKHLVLKFDDSCKIWKMIDYSENGTFILLKNFEEYSRRKPGKKLILNSSCFDDICIILVGKYVFVLEMLEY